MAEIEIATRLGALAELGYEIGVGAVDADDEPISYRVAGYGIDTTIPVDDADEWIAGLKESHESRVEEEAKTPEIREAEAEAAVAELETARQTRIDKLTAKIEASNLPAGVKTILEEIAEAALNR